MKYALILAVLAASPAQAYTYFSTGYWDHSNYYYCGDCPTTSRYDITIETDGTLGFLSESNILAWHFDLEGSGSESEIAAGFTRSAVSSSLEGAKMSWDFDGTLHADKLGRLMVSQDTDITFSNDFYEGDKNYYRRFDVTGAKLKSYVDQYDYGQRDDTFGTLVSSMSDFDTLFSLGQLVPSAGPTPVQLATFSTIPNAGSTPAPIPLPASAALLLLGALSLVGASKQRSG